MLDISLPIGISFYTFSNLIIHDIFQIKLNLEKRYTTQLGAYVSLFA